MSPSYTGLGYESVQLDDLLGDDYSGEIAIESAFRLFGDLVGGLQGKTGNVMASLVIVLGCDTEMQLQTPGADQVGAAWDPFTPPEFYLQPRAPRARPYVVEECKKPYPVSTFPAAQGVYFGYRRCHRNEGFEEFVRASHIR